MNQNMSDSLKRSAVDGSQIPQPPSPFMGYRLKSLSLTAGEKVTDHPASVVGKMKDSPSALKLLGSNRLWSVGSCQYPRFGLKSLLKSGFPQKHLNSMSISYQLTYKRTTVDSVSIGTAGGTLPFFVVVTVSMSASTQRTRKIPKSKADSCLNFKEKSTLEHLNIVKTNAMGDVPCASGCILFLVVYFSYTYGQLAKWGQRDVMSRCWENL